MAWPQASASSTALGMCWVNEVRAKALVFVMHYAQEQKGLDRRPQWVSSSLIHRHSNTLTSF